MWKSFIHIQILILLIKSGIKIVSIIKKNNSQKIYNYFFPGR